ncbi:conserved oligomeric golgi complex component 4 [Fusarium mundagurra]|uniref:Conserved oligomeric Golgi complex subunit 4 n=1 Tax=Fusarium mundagurra TaxID=1567541 RepID=A0A8H6DB23_9HYPO|nr:conserved oligomeric golgi complex component 4 [Fusarium mundagurra]
MAKINDLMTVSSEAELRDVLDQLHEREDTLIDKLDAPTNYSRDFYQDLGGLDSLHGDLDMQLMTARSIHSALLSTAGDTAERLSTMMRALDTEKRRVEATLVVIDQVLELKACIAGLTGSMGAPQDWEAASNYLSRVSNIPEDVIRGDFALAVIPSIETPDPPWTTIQNARKSLCALFLREFKAATEKGEGEKVARFFKLFPVIGGRAEEKGLEAYGQYICQGMAETARSALKGSHEERGRQTELFYANKLTRLLEHIVQIINSHSGLVERHYGADKVVKVIERLQKEADVQGGVILDLWNDERAVNRMMADIKSYPFFFLSKSMMPVQRGISFALRGNELKKDDSDLDVKKVEGLFGEMTTMLRSWSLYKRFISSKCKGVLDQEETLPLPKFLNQCNLHEKISEKLIEPYKLTATFLFRRSGEKAFEMDTAPSGLSLSKPYDGSPPFILQAVDDIMYVVDNLLQHVLSTGNREVAVSVILAMGRVLESDFIRIIHRRMRDECYPKPPAQGGFPPEEKVISFMVLMNTLDVAKEYLERVASSRGYVSETQRASVATPTTQTLRDSFPFHKDAESVANALHTMNVALSVKAKELLNDGIRALFDEFLWPHIRLVLTTSFQDAVYDVSEGESFDEDEVDGDTMEQVSARFEGEWLALTRPLKRIMTPRTYAALTSLAANKLATVLEKRAWSSSGHVTALGSLRLESDFSGIISVIAKDNYSLHEPFTRLREILAIADMEDDEWDELESRYDSSEHGRSRFLSDEEMAKARKICDEKAEVRLEVVLGLSRQWPMESMERDVLNYDERQTREALSSYNIIVRESMSVDKDFRALAELDQESSGLPVQAAVNSCQECMIAAASVQSNEMAAPEPEEATPATAIEVADEDDAMILSDDNVNLVTQLAAKFGEHQRTEDQLQRTVDQLQKTINELQKTVNEQQKTIQQPVEHHEQGLTGHNQGASQIAEDDDPMKNWADDYEDEGEDDDEMEKMARYYYFGGEDEDDDERENLFTLE